MPFDLNPVYILSGLLGALLPGSTAGITVGSYLIRAIPERFLRGVLATTLTAVAAKLVM